MNRMETAFIRPAVPSPIFFDRNRFMLPTLIFIVLVHVGAVFALWQTTWSAVLVAITLHVAACGLGIAVGFHRLLTHRSYKCPKAIEYALAFLGSLSIEGGPISWVTDHRQHHQFPDQAGDPHSAREGFLWSHVLWLAWKPTHQDFEASERRYAPDLLRVPFYRFLDRMYVVLSIGLGVMLYLLGGWPWVVWGICVRLVWTYHSTWLVNSASHAFGYRKFKTDDLSSNCWWVALLSFGEGWHNNHHAFPTSARHGLHWWEFDPSYLFIRLLEKLRLASDLHLPSPQQMEILRARQT
jgi:fatty-acid desaturase